jgi:hypothetical protein
VLQQELAALEAFRQFSRTVCSITEAGEADQGFGSPTITSPSIARLAETPP